MATANKKNKNKKKKKGRGRSGCWISLGMVILALMIAVSFFLFNRWDERTKRVRLRPQEVSPPEGQIARKNVQIFFSSANEDVLVAESGEISISEGLAEQVRMVIKKLVEGPRSANLLSTFPPGTVLRDVFLDISQGYAYVDLSREVIRNHPGGSQAEALTIFSLVNTLTYNFRQIRKVQILIEGKEAETLAGHVFIQRPLAADPSWTK